MIRCERWRMGILFPVTCTGKNGIDRWSWVWILIFFLLVLWVRKSYIPTEVCLSPHMHSAVNNRQLSMLISTNVIEIYILVGLVNILFKSLLLFIFLQGAKGNEKWRFEQVNYNEHVFGRHSMVVAVWKFLDKTPLVDGQFARLQG